MENPIILITSSSEGEGAVGGKERDGTVRWKSKLDEYRIISDLGGFKNLKAMMEAEACMRRKNRNRKKGKIEFCAQEEVNVNAAKDKEQLSKDGAVEVVELSKPESFLISEIDEPQNIVISVPKEKEDAGTVKVVEMTKAIGADRGVNSAEVIDLCLSSSEAQAISDLSFGRGVEDTVPAGPLVRKKKKKRRRRKKRKMAKAKDKVDDAKEEDEVKDNMVLRMLLRRPRYFDFPDCIWGTCSNCGNENHTPMSCTTQKHKKPCFLCGSSKHSWKYCKQGQDSFLGKGRDHLVNYCPETEQGNNLSSNICLRCGDSGHDMFSCRSNYPADDLKEIQCYICKSIGHLCCINFPDMGLKQLSCYNCGRSGHLGSGCVISCEAPGGAKLSVLCYKCGEEGHFARRCGSHVKGRLRISDLLSTAERVPNKTRNHTQSSSTPHNLCKS